MNTENIEPPKIILIAYPLTLQNVTPKVDDTEWLTFVRFSSQPAFCDLLSSSRPFSVQRILKYPLLINK